MNELYVKLATNGKNVTYPESFQLILYLHYLCTFFIKYKKKQSAILTVIKHSLSWFASVTLGRQTDLRVSNSCNYTSLSDFLNLIESMFSFFKSSLFKSSHYAYDNGDQGAIVYLRYAINVYLNEIKKEKYNETLDKLNFLLYRITILSISYNCYKWFELRDLDKLNYDAYFTRLDQIICNIFMSISQSNQYFKDD